MAEKVGVLKQYWPILAAAAVVIAGYGANMREQEHLRQAMLEQVKMTAQDRAELNQCKQTIATFGTDLVWIKRGIEKNSEVLEEIRRNVQ